MIKRNIKRTAAFLTAILSVSGAAGCGSSSKTSSGEDVSQVETVVVNDTSEIDAIPDGAETEIRWMGTYDLNPAKGKDKSVEMSLFNNKGGTVVWDQVIDSQKFDKLAAAIMSKQNVPDIFKYEWLAFPCQVVKDMYQPVDSIVSFDDPLWADTKETADQFEMAGEHYVAPISFEPTTFMMYDYDLIQSEGLDDPYELYKNGEWNWNNWVDIIDTFCSNATGDDIRYGVNGWFNTQIIQQTGKTMINYDKANNQFTSNLNDPDIERAENMLYDLAKNGYILNEWTGSASATLKGGNVLFYVMGTWAMTGNAGPKDGDDWRIVPMPSDPNTDEKYMSSAMTAYMWVKGSTKKEAVKTWYECCRMAATSDEYKENGNEKFLNANPHWTEEMYQVIVDASSTDYKQIFDYGYGISGTLSDDNSNEDGSCVTRKLYEYTNNTDDSGHRYTWAELRETWGPTVESELKTINAAISSYIASKE